MSQEKQESAGVERCVNRPENRNAAYGGSIGLEESKLIKMAGGDGFLGFFFWGGRGYLGRQIKADIVIALR